jgi:hypothetical protein
MTGLPELSPSTDDLPGNSLVEPREVDLSADDAVRYAAALSISLSLRYSAVLPMPSRRPASSGLIRFLVSRCDHRSLHLSHCWKLSAI